MNKIFILLIAAAMAGCNFEYDSGTSSFSKGFGKSISLSCLKPNLKKIENLTIETEEAGLIVLMGSGIKSTIEFESENSVISSYSITTKTEKSKDGEIHKIVESAVNAPCEM